MKRPIELIEKYGWEESKENLTGYDLNYERFKRRELLSFDDSGCVYLRTDGDFIFEELQAIYETAEQIRKGNK